ncbi:MAG TPA: hypothetical protein DDY98_02630, partial [Ruminococcaceae bacterium]|nr:hypothetical protein [Oscillospiraceae bacterium]
VDDAESALRQAIEDVAQLPDCNYDDLNDAIAAYEEIEDVIDTNYTPASVTDSNVKALYQAAKDVNTEMLDDEAGVNQGVIDAAASALSEALEALVPKADKTALKTAIDGAPTLTEDIATAESWGDYETALAAAKGVYDDDNASVSDVTTATTNLNAAKNLESRPICKYDDLTNALALTPTKDQSEYSEVTWNAYNEAKLEAQAISLSLINNKAGTNQKLVDDAAAKLALAFSRLRGNGCTITTFVCTQEHYMKNDVVSFAFTSSMTDIAKVQVVHDGYTMTYDRSNAAVTSIVNNGDGTETWYINIKIYNDGEFVYSARAKSFNAAGGWDDDYIDFYGKTSTGDDAEVKSVSAIVGEKAVTTFTTNDTVTLQIVAGKDTQRVRFTDSLRKTTMTLSTPKKINEDGTKVYEVTRKLSEVREYTFKLDTADSTNKWTASDKTLVLNVTKYVPAPVLPTTGDYKDAVISVDASNRVLRFRPQTFTVVTDKNASGFRLVDKNGTVAASVRTGGVVNGDQTTWTLTKYYSAANSITYRVEALFGKTWIDSGKTISFTVAY